MIAKRFSRADASLLAHLSVIRDDDLHFPISEQRLIHYFERATARSALVDIQRFRSQLPSSEYHEDGSNARLTLHAAILLATALKETYDIPAVYLREVLMRVATDSREDDQRCCRLLKKCSEFVLADKGLAIV